MRISSRGCRPVRWSRCTRAAPRGCRCSPRRSGPRRRLRWPRTRSTPSSAACAPPRCWASLGRAGSGERSTCPCGCSSTARCSRSSWPSSPWCCSPTPRAVACAAASSGTRCTEAASCAGPSKAGSPALLWIALAALAFQQAGFLGIAAPGLLGHFGRFARQLFPPDLSAGFLASLIEPLWQTVSISVVGTAIGIALGGALSLPATATLLLDRRDPPGMLGRAVRLFAYSGSRLLLAMLRSIPELVWVLLCILAVGLGPFAGALALGLHTAGVLGKLYAETLEEVPDGPVEELRAAGATRPQRLLWAMWPQAREMLLGYTLLRWETNLRVSTVVGLVGGGGLGLALYNSVQLGFYPRVATLVLLIYLLVSVTDWLSDRVRAPQPKPG